MVTNADEIVLMLIQMACMEEFLSSEIVDDLVRREVAGLSEEFVERMEERNVCSRVTLILILDWRRWIPVRLG
ncbi:hypothetical protein ACOSQ3_024937 [Xanthoceras sorbifolium]